MRATIYWRSRENSWGIFIDSDGEVLVGPIDGESCRTEDELRMAFYEQIGRELKIPLEAVVVCDPAKALLAERFGKKSTGKKQRQKSPQKSRQKS
jgi:hypothetical protein